ncbi:hypothetical protein LUW77_27300 [Streptomyces radiopugnans]|nr:hypothetical protein LUW77_27300 [Streptomyces radiopugnans]
MSLPEPEGRRRGRCRSGFAARTGAEAARAALGPQAPLEGLVFCLGPTAHRCVPSRCW